MNNQNEDNSEYVFRIPFSGMTNIFDTIENMLYQLNSNPNIISAITNSNDSEYVHFDIFFDENENENEDYNNMNDDTHTHDNTFNGTLNGIYNGIHNDTHNDTHQLMHQHPHFHIHHYNDLEENNYFKSCNEINEKLTKPEKIKKDDNILSENCFICMETYKESELKRSLPSCKHYFHKKCIDKWLKKKASCPICRDKLL